jgi:integrase
MAKQRSGYVYEETTWYALVEYKDPAGKRHKIKRRAKSQAHANQLAEITAAKIKERLGPKIKTRAVALTESGGWYARATYVDDRGRRKNVKRRAENKTAAKEILKQLIRDLDDHGGQLLDASQMTFAHLADYYQEHYLVEPQYVHGRKVAGLRSYKDMAMRLRILKGFFGRHKLRAITYADLRRFRADRLKSPVIWGKNTRGTDKPGKPTLRQRSVTTVNRELSLLKRIFNIAVSQGWIKRNPFGLGDSLITPGDERKRERIITREEEARLLAACTGKREHLRAIIICAIDTGMRKGEILKILTSDLDFGSRIILVRAFNTKTMRERQVAMTDRLARELQRLWQKLPDGEDTTIFGTENDFKNAFITARKLAGLPDVRFHDLRHTHATRLVAAHVPLSEVGRALGHTQANTTFRYVNANVETARKVASVLDEFNRSVDQAEAEMIN